MDKLSELYKGYPSVVEVPVAWGEMDAARHVNNAVYFRYMESGRIVLFREWDFTGFSGGIGPILAEIQCRYKAPVTFPDTLRVATRVVSDSLHTYGFDLHQLMISNQLGRIVAEGRSVIVSYDYSILSKTSLPEPIVRKIRAM